jgi:hypothetical protein
MAAGQEIEARLLGGLTNQAPSLSERLDRERERLEERLAEIKRLQSAFERNPEMQELLDCVARLGNLGY